MKKTSLVLGLGMLLIIPTMLNAQLSDRVNAPSTYVIGTRPVANDKGIQISTSYKDLEGIFDDNRDFEALPVVTFKHYRTATQVITLGIKTDKEKVKLKGELETTNGEIEYQDMQSHFLIVPGIEKHFGSANILDVFVGTRIPLGLERQKSVQIFDGLGSTSSRNSFGYGIDLFTGIQAFIGDLPVALGLELNYSFFSVLGEKYKVVETGGTENEYYSPTNPDVPAPYDSQDYEKLSASHSEMTSDFRISLVYFFRR